MPRCAGWKIGACARCGPRSTGCSLSAPAFRESRPTLRRRNSGRCARKTVSRPIWSFATPYVLDFLGLHDSYSERDLEAAILREMESFLLELGNGFAFIARQKRIRVDEEDFYIDLLLYHRKLRQLVAVDLKLEKFRPEHAGQMEFYLRWLAKHEQQPREESPLGLILCSAKSQERIELMELGKAGIRVAEYLTVLPPRQLLAKKLHEAIRQAQARLLPDSPPSPDRA